MKGLKFIFAILALLFFITAYNSADFVNNPTEAWILNLGWAIFLGLFLFLDRKY